MDKLDFMDNIVKLLLHALPEVTVLMIGLAKMEEQPKEILVTVNASVLVDIMEIIAKILLVALLDPMDKHVLTEVHQLVILEPLEVVFANA